MTTTREQLRGKALQTVGNRARTNAAASNILNEMRLVEGKDYVVRPRIHVNARDVFAYCGLPDLSSDIEQFGEKVGDELFVDLLILPAMATEIISKHGHEEWSYDLLNFGLRSIAKSQLPAYLELYGNAVATLVWHSGVRLRGPREVDYVVQLIQRLDTLVPGCKVSPASHRGDWGVPDLVIEVDGELRPIEVKAKPITGRCVEQCLRYVSGLGATKGYVASHLCALALPPNIEFLPLSEIKTDE